MPRRYYSSTAAQTTLSAGVDGVTSTMAVTAVSGWPSSFPYTILVDKDTVNEEIVTVTARTGTTLTVTRGADGTSAVAHSAGANVQHGVSARDFDEPNAFVNGTGVVTSAMIADGTIVNADINASAAIAQSKIATLTTDLAAKSNVYPTQDVQSGTTYTFDLDNAKELVIASSASAKTFTVPAQASVTWLDNTQLQVLNTGAGLLTVEAAAGVTINGAPLVLVQNRGGSLVRTASNVWTFIPFSGGADKAVVSSSTAASVTSVTVGGLPAKVYKFTSTGSITFLAAGVVDVICQGPGGPGGSDAAGGGGAGGFIEKTNVYVPSGSQLVYVDGDTTQGSQGTGASSFFNGIVAIGGGNGSFTNYRMPSGGGCGGGNGGAAPATFGLGTIGQGLIAVSAGVTRGGNGAGYGGGGGGINGNASGTTGGAGYDPGAELGSPGTLGQGGNGNSSGTPTTANSGNGGNRYGSGKSGVILVRVYD